MSDDDATWLWLVERSHDDRDLIILIYVTSDGEHELWKELAAAVMHQRRVTVTAAIDAPTENLEPVDDDDLRERYAAEVMKMVDSHEPDDEVRRSGSGELRLRQPPISARNVIGRDFRT